MVGSCSISAIVPSAVSRRCVLENRRVRLAATSRPISQGIVLSEVHHRRLALGLAGEFFILILLPPGNHGCKPVGGMDFGPQRVSIGTAAVRPRKRGPQQE